jgi:glutamate/aspartate transport system substrate-binding protein
MSPASDKEQNLKHSVARTVTALLLCGVGTAALGLSSTQEQDGTLKRIKQTNTIAVGYYEAEIPFSYVDGKGQVIGYSYDITQKIVQAVAAELNLPKIEVKPIRLTLHNRFSMIQNESADIECGVSTNNTERRKDIAFSNAIFVSRIRLMARKDAHIADFPDLAGKSVVTKASSTSEVLLKKMNARIKFSVVSAVDRSVSPLTLLQTGQADAYVLDEILLYGTIADSWRPNEWLVTGTPQSVETYGCTMRRADTAFKAIVDQTITKLMQSGQAAALYKKWLLSPIPPMNRALNVPMSDEIIRLYHNPNDNAE